MYLPAATSRSPLFIDAIASAQVAARSMHGFLRGTRTGIAVRSPQRRSSAVSPWPKAGSVRRAAIPVIDPVQRASSLEIIEESYPAAEAHRQASRCLRCNVNTVFDTSICIACTGCVDART